MSRRVEALNAARDEDHEPVPPRAGDFYCAKCGAPIHTVGISTTHGPSYRHGMAGGHVGVRLPGFDQVMKAPRGKYPPVRHAPGVPCGTKGDFATVLPSDGVYRLMPCGRCERVAWRLG